MPPAGPGSPVYQAPAVGPQQNTKAIIGLVCGVLGLIMAFCCSFLGVPLGLASTILGYLAKQEIAASGGSQSGSSGLAQGAFVVGIIAMALSALMIVLGLVLNIGLGMGSLGKS